MDWAFLINFEKRLFNDLRGFINPCWISGIKDPSSVCHIFYRKIRQKVKADYNLKPGKDPYSVHLFKTFLLLLSKLNELDKDFICKNIEDVSEELLRWLLVHIIDDGKLLSGPGIIKLMEKVPEAQIQEMLKQLLSGRKLPGDDVFLLVNHYLHKYKKCVFTTPFIISCGFYWKQYSRTTSINPPKIISDELFLKFFIKEFGNIINENKKKFELEKFYGIDEIWLYHSVTAVIFMSYDIFNEKPDDLINDLNFPLTDLLNYILIRVIYTELKCCPIIDWTSNPRCRILRLLTERNFLGLIYGCKKEFKPPKRIGNVLDRRKRELNLVYNICTVPTNLNMSIIPADYSEIEKQTDKKGGFNYPSLDSFINDYKNYTLNFLRSLLSHYGKTYSIDKSLDWKIKEMADAMMGDAGHILFLRYVSRNDCKIRDKIYNQTLLYDINNLNRQLFYHNLRKSEPGKMIENYPDEWFGIQLDMRTTNIEQFREFIEEKFSDTADINELNGLFPAKGGKIDILKIRAGIRNVVNKKSLGEGILLDFDRRFLHGDEILFDSLIENLVDQIPDTYDIVEVKLNLEIFMQSSPYLKDDSPLYKLMKFVIDFPGNITDEDLLSKKINKRVIAEHLEMEYTQIRKAVEQFKKVIKQFGILEFKTDENR